MTVKGIAVCNKRRLARTEVKLMEKDTSESADDRKICSRPMQPFSVDPDDELATVLTNSEGEFLLKGGEDEVNKESFHLGPICVFR